MAILDLKPRKVDGVDGPSNDSGIMQDVYGQARHDEMFSNLFSTQGVGALGGNTEPRADGMSDALRQTEIDVERQIQIARAMEPWYACGYCGVKKTSCSTGKDGRVRIRCECGGKHRDGKARMHANWRPCSAVSKQNVYAHR